MEEKKVTVFEAEDLQKSLGLKGAVGRWLSAMIIRILEIDKVNRIQEKYPTAKGADMSDHTLEEIGVSFEIPSEQLELIPREGGFFTVSNHHFGSIDGLILNSIVGRRRPDFRILTTFMLTMIPGLRDSFIPVDNFSSGGSKSITGIRAALGHIAEGKPLGFFPAGEVATWQKGKNRTAPGENKIVEDIPWAENIIKLIKKSSLPVIPIYFEGENSKMFHILGRIHPRLRTIRLVHEMFNKKGTVVKVRIGQPITLAEMEGFDVPSLGRYLRSRCYALQAQCEKPVPTSKESKFEPIDAPVSKDLILSDARRLESNNLLFASGDYKMFLFHPNEAPSFMKELCRLREETFRAIGEGTGLNTDTDSYDEYYWQMVLWNVPSEEIVGAYRLGPCGEILKERGGIKGIYCASLFNYSPQSEALLSRCIELGRSFVISKYQREVQPLKLLLAGLAVTMTRSPQVEYVTGPVSVSNAIPDFYKSLIVRFFENSFSLPGAEKIVVPTNPFKPDYMAVNPDDLLAGVKGNVDTFDRLLGALSDGKYRLPVLFRKYFSCSAKLACFNVDPLFNNSLDGLIFLRLSEFPVQTLKSLLRGLPEDLQNKTLTRFYGANAQI